MKISWIKSKNDDKSFKIYEALGFKVYNLDEPEKIDEKINELIEKDYRTIIISNEIASFSTDVITKYKKRDDISIIITSSNNIENM